MNIRSKQSIPVICNHRYALPGKTEELKRSRYMRNIEERIDLKQRVFTATHEENRGMFEAT